MRVVYLSNGNIPSRWAHTFQVMKMAEALAAQVGELELVTSRSLWPSAANRADLSRWYGVSPSLRVVRLPVRLFAGDFYTHYDDPRFDQAAALYARRRRPDLVFSRSLGAGLRCAVRGLPTVIETHVPAGARTSVSLRRCAALPALRALVTVTDALRDDWVAAGVRADRIHVWPDAVDLEHFHDAPTAREARSRLGLPQEGALAVYCGHFYEEKGVGTLIDAARRLEKATVLLVGGWPADIARVRDRARDCETLRLAGFVPNEDVPLHLAAADVLVLPNSARFPQARTTSPLKLFEYMAARRPIVATRIPALEGLLRHGHNAWTVAPDDPEALAEGIEHVLASPELAARLADRAWQDVQGYTWRRRAADLLALAAAERR
ncbi:MAG TPA: glycosyltransferase family 4 protein [Myxococcota bacterium]|nr:glycosyltransferase family 4 protein [Myxococcota bacterium]